MRDKRNGHFSVDNPVGSGFIRSAVPLDRSKTIDARLAAIDVEAIRPLRAIVIGAGTQFDTDKLAALEVEAATLRAERAALASGG